MTTAIMTPSSFAPSLAFNFDVTGAEIDFGSATELDNLDPLTYWIWLYRTADAIDPIIRKGDPAGLQFISFDLDTGGNIFLFRLRATTNTEYFTNSNPIPLNIWTFVVMTYDSSAGAGEVVNVFSGGLTSVVSEAAYATSTDGSGANSDDSGDVLHVGGFDLSAAGFSGRIAAVGVVNRALNLLEVEDIRLRTSLGDFSTVPGTVLQAHLGQRGFQLDVSGFGNHGAATTATVPADGPPIPLVHTA